MLCISEKRNGGGWLHNGLGYQKTWASRRSTGSRSVTRRAGHLRPTNTQPGLLHFNNNLLNMHGIIAIDRRISVALWPIRRAGPWQSPVSSCRDRAPPPPTHPHAHIHNRPPCRLRLSCKVWAIHRYLAVLC